MDNLAQNVEKLDSLESEFKNNPDELLRLKAGQNLINDFYLRSNKKRASELAKVTLSLAKKLNAQEVLVEAYRHNAIYAKLKFDLPLAHSYIDSALTVIQKISSTLSTGRQDSIMTTLYGSSANIYTAENNLVKANEEHHKCLEIAQRIEAYNMISICYYNIGSNFFQLNNFDEALDKYKQAYTIAVDHNVDIIESTALYMIGSVYQQLDSLEKAEDYARQSLILSKKNNLEIEVAYGELALGLIFEKQTKLDSALHYFDRALTTAKSADDIAVETQVYLNRARIEYQLNKFPAARKTYAQFKAMNQVMNNDELEVKSLIDIAQLEHLSGNHKKAFELLDLGRVKTDSLQLSETSQRIKRLELQYNKAADEKTIANQELTLVKRKRNNFLLGSSLIFSLLGGLLIYALLNNSQKKKALVQKELSLQKLKNEKLEKAQHVLALSATLEGQEAERSRIAKDLHDGLGGLLTSVKAHYAKIQGEIVKLENLNIYDRAEKMMDTACEEVRRISHNLMPPLLQSQGLVAAIQNLASHFEIAHDIEIQLDIRNMDKRMDEKKEIFLYRICQELLNNIAKHAEASKVEINLYRLENQIQLIVEDNGKGFDLNAQRDGLGLVSISSRTDYLNGTLDLDSDDNGSSISVTIPM